MSDFLRASYRIRSEPARARERARLLALEQTVELPDAAVRDRLVRERVVGRVEEVRPLDDGVYRVEIAYPAGSLDGGAAQLMNVLFGNVSLLPDVELLDLDPPPTVLDTLGGPRFGIEGIRETTAVRGRPLTCAALKPVGLECDALALLCGTFARAGIDVVKDDHGFAEQDTAPFERRVQTCQRAMDDAAEETGRRALYVPNLIGDPERILRQAEFARECGTGAVMTEPMLAGLPFFSSLVRDHLEVPVIAHPAMAGATRIAPAALLGKLFRLAGADAVIFPHSGGRFAYDEATCAELSERMRKPWSGLLPTLPVPAGGMEVERIGEMIAFYGNDVMFLIGGSLYLAGERLGERAEAFARAVRSGP